MPNPLAAVALVANTVTAFVLDADYDRVEVLSVNGTAAIYFTTNGINPVINADGCHVIPAAVSALEVGLRSNSATVKCISAGTPLVAVRGIDNF